MDRHTCTNTTCWFPSHPKLKISPYNGAGMTRIWNKISFKYLYMLGLSFFHQFLCIYWYILVAQKPLLILYRVLPHSHLFVSSFRIHAAFSTVNCQLTQLYYLHTQLVQCSEAWHFMAAFSQLRILVTIYSFKDTGDLHSCGGIKKDPVTWYNQRHPRNFH